MYDSYGNYIGGGIVNTGSVYIAPSPSKPLSERLEEKIGLLKKDSTAAQKALTALEANPGIEELLNFYYRGSF